MSIVPYQIVSRNTHIPTLQEMEPINTIEGGDLQSAAFSTIYGGNWLADMQFNGPIDPTYVNYSRDNSLNMQSAGPFNDAFADLDLNFPTDMQPPGQFADSFVDPSLNGPTYIQPPGQFNQALVDQSQTIPTYMQSDRQFTQPFVDQSQTIPAHMQSPGQFTGASVDQSPNLPTHMQPAGQSILTSPDQGRDTPTNIQGIGQLTTNATNQSRNVSTNIQPLGQHTQAPINHGGNTTTNVPPDGQATLAPAPYGGNGNKTMEATRSSPASAQGRKKDPAIVEDKDIERSAGEYNFSYDEIRILKDYANARLKGIETSEPEDAPSRYIISRFEQVRRTYPQQATWPYDIPKEKIIRLLPGQKRQDRAPVKSHDSACKKRREELDARFQESRQWEGPPPPTPSQTHQDKSTTPSSSSLLPTLTLSEHVNHWPFHQNQPKEERPFILPNLNHWPAFAPIICHPLVRALELHAGRKDPFSNEEFKGYTIPVANYKARIPQFPAPADSTSTPEAEFMPQGYAMTEELRREIEQRIVMHMKIRWGMDDAEDDIVQKARSGELVREDLSELNKKERNWRYRMVYWVEKWGLGGVQGSELSEDCTISDALQFKACWSRVSS